MTSQEPADPEEPPTDEADFTERLQWLLRTVAAAPGTGSRISINTLTIVLAAVDAEAGSGHPAPGPVLSDSLIRGIDPGAPALRPHIAALEALFRLPRGYFVEADIRRATDERIVLASRAGALGVRVIGPCRATLPRTEDDRHRTLSRIIGGRGRAADSA